CCFFFSSRRRHTRFSRDWSSDVCSSDLDAFEEAQEGVVRYYMDKGKSEDQARELADDEDEYDKTFYIPPVARWGAIKDLKHDIGSELNTATEAIEEYNPRSEEHTSELQSR